MIDKRTVFCQVHEWRLDTNTVLPPAAHFLAGRWMLMIWRLESLLRLRDSLIQSDFESVSEDLLLCWMTNRTHVLPLEYTAAIFKVRLSSQNEDANCAQVSSHAVAHDNVCLSHTIKCTNSFEVYMMCVSSQVFSVWHPCLIQTVLSFNAYF